MSCFNPVLGFLGVSTSSRGVAFCSDILFQSRAGFSGRLDQRRQRPNRQPTHRVSIPCWVFWASRHLDDEYSLQEGVEFQSRAGFSGRLDNPPIKSPSIWSSFNPVLGFLGVSTAHWRRSLHRDTVVSIPCWVFWASRQVGSWSLKCASGRFNPVLGFLGVSTGADAPDADPQSTVSIPCWVFWASRPFVPKRDRLGYVFQSRAGFSGRLDSARGWSTPTLQCFNPVLGFLGVSTGLRHRNVDLGDVSIPCWVFWASRPSGAVGPRTGRRVSIPCWVFWASRRKMRAETRARIEAFQSRAGFSGRLDAPVSRQF